MKKLLILQNSDETPPGTTLAWCQERQIEAVVIPFWLQQTVPWGEEFLGVVVCGGGMNVDQEHLYPWLKEEKKLLGQFLKTKTPTLGLCLGAQLMAEVLGAKVGPANHWEVGWHPVHLLPHPLLPSGKSDLLVFQWHGYTFATPSTAVALGHSEACAHQAFAIGDHALAFQFHPESTQEWIRECAESPAEEYPTGPYVQNANSILNQINAQAPLQNWYWEVLDRFFLKR